MALILASACSVDEQNIEGWKTTQHGPFKIRWALRDSDRPIDLRVAAAVALVEIGQVEEMAGDLGDLAPNESVLVADGAAGRLVRLLSDSRDERQATRAKDALFAIRAHLSPAIRNGADRAVSRWLAADLGKRALAGAHGADRIVTSLGAAAAEPLLALLEQPNGGTGEAARLIALIDDDAIRERAAESLIAQAREDPARQTVFLGLARIGGAKTVAFLSQVALDGSPDARLYALRALETAPSPLATSAAARIAGDDSLEGEEAPLRDEAFAVLEAILGLGDQTARAALLGFLGSRDDKIRWRAIGAIVESSDLQGLADLLDALPEVSLENPNDLQDYVEAPLRLAGARVLPTLRAALSSKSPVGRLVAARALATLGQADDESRLRDLARDRTRLAGWSGLATVGAEADAAATRLRARAP